MRIWTGSTQIALQLNRWPPETKNNAHKNVYISPDLTPRQRKEAFELREEMRQRRGRGEKGLKIVKGKIVQVPQDLPKSTRPHIQVLKVPMNASGRDAVASTPAASPRVAAVVEVAASQPKN